MTTGRSLLYLNTHRAIRGQVDDLSLASGYVDACRFMHCGIVDRSQVIHSGPAFQIFDHLPPASNQSPSFGELCDRTADQLVSEAGRTGKQLQVMWSGGIDSTVVLLSLSAAARRAELGDQIDVLLTLDSIREYPDLFQSSISERIPYRVVGRPVAEFLDPEAITVTGEHGDQLFGSQLLESYVRRGVAHAKWEDILPVVLLERLRHPLQAVRALGAIRPVLEAAPVPIDTLFDALWWLNFILKWQSVSLRIAVMASSRHRQIWNQIRHFFRGNDFQIWAMRRSQTRTIREWTDYKYPAKEYVYRHTGDENYLWYKQKEDSLRNLMTKPTVTTHLEIHMYNDFIPVIDLVEDGPDGLVAGLRLSLSQTRDTRNRVTVSSTAS